MPGARSFADMPIKQKLVSTIVVTTAAALLLSGAGILFADAFLFQRYLRHDLAVLSSIVGDNSTAALAFDDPHAAGETLGTLRARTHVISACIYRADRTILASYRRGGASRPCPPAAAGDEVRATQSSLAVSHPIVLQGRRIGTLVLLYDLGEIGERTRLFGLTILAVLLVSSVIAFLLSSTLRSTITTPILQLAHSATAVSTTRDYSIRARKSSGDELGVLVDAFNEMLEGIQFRDSGLRKALIDRGAALAEAENARHFLETTLGSIGDAVISTDIEGSVAFANPVALALVGWPESEVKGKRLEEVFHIVNEFTRSAVESPVIKVLREGAIVGLANHTLLIRRDGSEIPIDDSAAPIRDASGTIQGTVLVFRDVTERRRAEEVTRRLASIVESSEDAIIGHDLSGLFTSWNRGAERIFGYSADEIIGRSTSVIAGAEQDDEMPGILARIARGERIEQFQGLRRTKSGKLVDVSITVSPIYDELGRIVGASKIARDITEQVRSVERLAQLNAALQRSNESLARSNEDLERFAFVASHDLQEPLRMITIYSQLLVKAYTGDADPRARMFIEYISGGARRMQELLADLLAYAEIGALVDDSRSATDLDLVLAEVKQNLKAAIDESGAQLAADPLPTVIAHRAQFIALFQNLIGNAIKYRSADPPRIRISVRDETGQIRFSVTDNGIGIEAEYLEKVFVPFKRLHGKQIPGTGIGLAICQRVVEHYGGRIWVESEAGHGSTFIFTLPASARVRREG